MKLYMILYMLFVVANGEKKINLEDIERDNLKAESKSKSEDIRTDDKAYLVKPETNQQHYQLSSGQYDTPAGQSTYVTPQPVQNIPPEEYKQPNKYSTNEVNYQQQETLQPYEIQALQQYAEYQLREAAGLKNDLSSIYNPRPEDQAQSLQIKGLAEMLAKGPGKDNAYVNIPMGQFLSYYPHINLNGFNTAQVQPSYRELAPAQQISIPFYTPHFGQKQLIGPVKMSYQIVPQYALRQPYSVSTPYFHKYSKGPVYTTLPSKNQVAPSSFVPPVYEQQDQSYAQGKQFLYTQAYIAQPQRQQVSPLIYNQGKSFYAQATPLQADFYARSPVYVQDNFLHGQVNQYSGQPEQSYTAPVTEQQQLPRQNLHQEESQSVSQNYVKIPDEPNIDFVPPQITHHQKFKPDVTQLVPVSSDHEEAPRAKQQFVSSEPRSLLDTYIPSNLIASRDSARYRERPLHLESGFLPSKTNFVQYKKRKTTQ